MRFLKNIVLFVILIIGLNAVQAQQVFPVQVNGFMIPPRSLDLSVYTFERSQDLLFNATLNDPIEPFRDVRLNLTIRSNNQDIYVTDPNFAFQSIRLNQFDQITIDGAMLAPYLNPSAMTGATGFGTGSVEIPEGFNSICLEVIDVQRNIPISNQFCISGFFQLNQPPQLVRPACGEQMPFPETQNLLFNWTPMHIGSGNSPNPVQYTFELVKLLPGVVDPNDGFNNALKLFETTTMAPSLIYSQAEPLLEAGAAYAWRVKAESMLHPSSLLFENEGYSEVCTFTYTLDEESTETDAEEDVRAIPQGCEVFATDFGPVNSTNADPIPLVEGDIVKVGYFDLEVLDAIPSGDGFSGTGFITVPMLKAKLPTTFSNLKVKGNMRAYSIGSMQADVEQTFYLDPSLMVAGNYENLITNDYVESLNAYFSNGAGQNKLLSGFNPSDPAVVTLPIGLDKEINGEQQPLIAIAGLRFTERNAFMTCVGYEKVGAEWMRFAGVDLNITPLGVKSNSVLTLLDDVATPVSGLFEMNIVGGTNGSGMGMDCSGFSTYNYDVTMLVNENIMVKAADESQIEVGLKNQTSDPSNYLGEMNQFEDFVLPQMPGFVFSMKKGELDLKLDSKIADNDLGNLYQESQEEAWQGLYLNDVGITLPPEYDFTGSGEQLTLDKGDLALSEEGAWGTFKKENLVTFEEGKLGNWRYSVDTMTLSISGSETDKTTLSGRIAMPLLDEPFAYNSNLDIESTKTVMEVKPQPSIKGMSLWGGQFETDEYTEINAELKEVNGNRKFFPFAQLNGKLSIELTSEEFEAKMAEEGKEELLADLKEIFETTETPSFSLKDLMVVNLSVDPFGEDEYKYAIESYGDGKDSININGENIELAGMILNYQSAEADNLEELALQIYLRKNGKLVQYNFVASANSTGGFNFDRIEVQTKNITCECIMNQFDTGFNPDIYQNYKEDYYEKNYSPEALGFKPFDQNVGSLASAGGALKNENILQKLMSGELKGYKEAVMQHIQDNMLAGMIYDGNRVILPWGDAVPVTEQEINGVAHWVGTIKDGWERKIVDGDGKEIYNKDKYRFEEIDNNLEEVEKDATGGNLSGKTGYNQTLTFELPIDLTNKLDKVNNITNPVASEFFGEDAENMRLLLTKFEIQKKFAQQEGKDFEIGTADINKNDELNFSVTTEFLLLVKTHDPNSAGNEKYLHFVDRRTDRIKLLEVETEDENGNLSKETGYFLNFDDFKLYLDGDIDFPGQSQNNRLSFSGGDTTAAVSARSFATLECNGFEGYNIRGELIFPQKDPTDNDPNKKTLLAPVPDPDSLTLSKDLVIGVEIGGKSLNNFMATVTASGQNQESIDVMVPGVDGLKFAFGADAKVVLDMSHDKNPDGMPQFVEGQDASPDWKGLVVQNLAAKIDGFTKTNDDGSKAPVTVTCRTFAIGSSGVYGEIDAQDVVVFNEQDSTKNSDVGGWAYSIDLVQAVFKGGSLAPPNENNDDNNNGNLQNNNGQNSGSSGKAFGASILVKGKVKVPFFKDAQAITYEGSLGFEKTSDKGVVPIADFAVGLKGFAPKLEVAGIGGLRMQLLEGTRIGFRYELNESTSGTQSGGLGGASGSAAGGSEKKSKGGFVPYAYLYADASLLLGPNDDGSGFNLEYSLLNVDGLKLNPSKDELDKGVNDGRITSRAGDNAGKLKDGIASIDWGTWSFGKSEGKPISEDDSGDDDVADNNDNSSTGLGGAANQSGDSSKKKKSGLQGFPITVSDLNFESASNGDYVSLLMTFNLNLMKNKVEDSGSSSGGSGSQTSGMAASTGLRFNFRLDKDSGKITNKELKTDAGEAVKAIQLETIAIAASYGPVDIKGSLVMFGNHEEYGDGFKAEVDVSMDFGKGFDAKGIAQFGTVAKSAANSSTYEEDSKASDFDPDFRYFYIDFVVKSEVGIKIPVGPVPVTIHGGGGGFMYNMDVGELVGDPATMSNYSPPTDPVKDPGQSLSDIKYIPTHGGFGANFKIIASVVAPQTLIVEGGVIMTIAPNDEGNLSFSTLNFTMDNYILAKDFSNYETDYLAKGGVDLQFNFIDGKIEGVIGFDMALELPPKVPVVKIETVRMEEPDKDTGEQVMVRDELQCKILIDFKEGKWYIKAGRPPMQENGVLVDRRMGFRTTLVDILEAHFLGYFQAGYDVDPMPRISDVVPNWDDDSKKPERSTIENNLNQTASGVAFGLALVIPKKDYKFAFFYASLEAGLGFDLNLRKYKQSLCPDIYDDSKFGLDGWWLRGQAYAYFKGNVGIEYDLGFTEGKAEIFSGNIAAGIQANFARPTVFKARLKMKYEVLGGLIKGNCNFKFIAGSDKDKDCLQMAEDVGSDVAGMPIIAGVTPMENDEDVPVFVEPTVAFNISQTQELFFEKYDDFTGESFEERNYRIQVTNLTFKKVGGAAVDVTLDVDHFITTIKPARLLEPFTEYQLTCTAVWQEEKGKDNWVTDNETEETKTITFTTGAMPDKIIQDVVAYHAPGNRQRYWHKGYADPRIIFKPADWDYLFPASSQETINGEDTEVFYDYVVFVNQMNGSEIEKTYQFPLSEYPGAAEYEVPIQKVKRFGTYYQIPYVELEKRSGQDVAFEGLKDLDLDPHKIYELKIMRLPAIPEVETKTEDMVATTAQATEETIAGTVALFGEETEETQETVGDEDIAMNFETVVRAGDMDVGDETTLNLSVRKLENAVASEYNQFAKELYEYHFASSKFTSLHEKIEAMSVSHKKSDYYRTDSGHPEEGKDLPDVSSDLVIGVRDDYFLFHNSEEGFDQYDLDRIRLNITRPVYEDLASWNGGIGQRTVLGYSDADRLAAMKKFWAQSAANSDKNVGFDAGKAKSYEKYFENVFKFYEDVENWNYHFSLVDNDLFELTNEEIESGNLTKSWRGTSLKDGSTKDNVFASNVNFSLAYQDVMSRTVSLQNAYLYLMRASFNEWDDDDKPAVGMEVLNLFLNYAQNETTSEWLNPLNAFVRASEADASVTAYWNQFTYKGNISMQFPKLQKWDNLGQQLSESERAIYPKMNLTFNTGTGIVQNTSQEESVAAGNYAVKVKLIGKAGNVGANGPADHYYEVSMEPYREDKPLNGLLIDNNWDNLFVSQDGEADIFYTDPNNKDNSERRIKRNTDFPGYGEDICQSVFDNNIDVKFTGKWFFKSLRYRGAVIQIQSDDEDFSHKIIIDKDLIPTEIGESVVFEADGNQYDRFTRQELVRLGRGIGANASMLNLQKIGMPNSFRIQSVIAFDSNDSGKVIFHKDESGTRRTYTYEGDRRVEKVLTDGNSNDLFTIVQGKSYKIYIQTTKGTMTFDVEPGFLSSGARGVSSAAFEEMNYWWQNAPETNQKPAGEGVSETGHLVPGDIAAADFDLGGQGVSYWSANASFENLNAEPYGIYLDTEGDAVTLNNGDWVEYTVNFESAGIYHVGVRLGVPGDVGMTVEIDGNEAYLNASSYNHIGATIETGKEFDTWGSGRPATVTIDNPGTKVIRLKGGRGLPIDRITIIKPEIYEVYYKGEKVNRNSRVIVRPLRESYFGEEDLTFRVVSLNTPMYLSKIFHLAEELVYEPENERIEPQESATFKVSISETGQQKIEDYTIEGINLVKLVSGPQRTNIRLAIKPAPRFELKYFWGSGSIPEEGIYMPPAIVGQAEGRLPLKVEFGKHERFDEMASYVYFKNNCQNAKVTYEITGRDAESFAFENPGQFPFSYNVPEDYQDALELPDLLLLADTEGEKKAELLLKIQDDDGVIQSFSYPLTGTVEGDFEFEVLYDNQVINPGSQGIILSNGTDFGNVTTGTYINRTFQIKNIADENVVLRTDGRGRGDVSITCFDKQGVELSNRNIGGIFFNSNNQPDDFTLDPGQVTEFTIPFRAYDNAQSMGINTTMNCEVSICYFHNNRPCYKFKIGGERVPPRPLLIVSDERPNLSNNFTKERKSIESLSMGTIEIQSTAIKHLQLWNALVFVNQSGSQIEGTVMKIQNITVPDGFEIIFQNAQQEEIPQPINIKDKDKVFLEIRFNPSEVRDYEGELIIEAINDIDDWSDEVRLTLSGEGISPFAASEVLFEASPLASPIDFGIFQIGNQVIEKKIIFKNTASEPARPLRVILPPNPEGFVATWAGSSTDEREKFIEPEGQGELRISFLPNEIKRYENINLPIQLIGTTTENHQINIELTGESTPGVAGINVTEQNISDYTSAVSANAVSSLDFGITQPGETIEKQIRLWNTGIQNSLDLGVKMMTIPEGYNVVLEGADGNGQVNIAPQQSKLLTITFAPPANQSVKTKNYNEENLKFELTGGELETLEIDLEGIAIRPDSDYKFTSDIAVADQNNANWFGNTDVTAISDLTFDEIFVTESQTKQFKVWNSADAGSMPLTFNLPEGNEVFEVSSSQAVNGKVNLESGDFAEITVQFQPLTTDDYEYDLSFNLNTGGEDISKVIELTGVGLVPVKVTENATSFEVNAVNSINFESTIVNTTSNEISTIKIWNIGAVPVGTLNWNATITDASGNVSDEFGINNQSGTIASGAGSEIQISFLPKSIDERTGKLTFTVEGIDEFFIIDLKGTGERPIAGINITANNSQNANATALENLSFETIDAGTTSEVQKLKIWNSGEALSQDLIVSLKGEVEGYSVVLENADTDGKVVVSTGNAAILAVTFTPSSTQYSLNKDFNQELVLSLEDLEDKTISLSGTAIQPEASVNITSMESEKDGALANTNLSFEKTLVGAESETQQLKIWNSAPEFSAPVTFKLEGGYEGFEVSLEGTNAEGEVTLDAGEHAILSVTFKPSVDQSEVIKSFSHTLDLTATGRAEITVPTISLSAESERLLAAISIVREGETTPADNLIFGNVITTTNSNPTKALEIKNTAAANSMDLVVTLPSNPEGYELSWRNADENNSQTKQIDAGSSAFIEVLFNPADDQTETLKNYNATIELSVEGGADETASVTLAGNGQLAAVAKLTEFERNNAGGSPIEVLEFGRVKTGETSPTQKLRLWNRTEEGSADLVLTTPEANELSGYSIEFDKTTISAGEYAEMSISFAPTIERDYTQNYTLDLSGVNSDLNTVLELRGEGSAQENIALGKDSKSSSNNVRSGNSKTNKGAAMRGVDGIPSLTWNDHSGVITDSQGGSWYEIDLGQLYEVEEIVIYTRSEDAGNRFSGFYTMLGYLPFPGFEDGTDGLDVNNALAKADWKTEREEKEFSENDLPNKIIFQPNSIGQYVRIQLANDYSERLTLPEVMVFGKAVKYAKGRITPVANSSINSSEIDNLNFGQIDIGTSATKRIQIWNTAPTDGALLKLNLPSNPKGFEITSEDAVDGILSIAPQQSAVVYFKFEPETPTNKNSLKRSYNKTIQFTGVNSYNFSLSGTGKRAAAVAKVTELSSSTVSSNSVTSLDFGTVDYDSDASNLPQRVVKIWNTASANGVPLNVRIPEAPAGFEISPTGNFSIAGGENVEVTITFSPELPTNATENERIYEDVELDLTGVTSDKITLTGKGRRAEAIAKVTEGDNSVLDLSVVNNLDFGTMEFGSTNNPTKQLKIENTASANSALLDVTIPEAPAGFEISPTGDFSIAGGERVEITITFSPELPTDATENERIYEDVELDLTGVTSDKITLTGKGTRAEAIAKVTEGDNSVLDLSVVNNLDFGTMEFGSANNPTKQLKIENTASANSALLDVTIPEAPAGFEISPTGDFSIAGGESLEITITFSPELPTDVNQKEKAYTDVKLDLGDFASEIKLKGVGVRPSAELAVYAANSTEPIQGAVNVDFGSITVAKEPGEQTLKIRNTASANSGLLKVTLPEDKAPYSYNWSDLNDASQRTISIAPQQEKILDISFSPSTAGTFNNVSMTLQIEDSDDKVISLSGEALRKTFGNQPIPLPGTIEMEHFDYGGQGISFNDDDQPNNGNQLRENEWPDIYSVSGETDNYRISRLVAGEWLEYEVDVANAGTYQIECRVAAGNNRGGVFYIEKDGEKISKDDITVESTGGMSSWEFKSTLIDLDKGKQKLRWVVKSISGSSFTIDKMVVKPVASLSIKAENAETDELEFGNVVAGKDEMSKTLTITNAGISGALDMIITLPNAPEGFSLNSTSAQNGKITLSPSESAELNIDFNPQIAKTYNSTIELGIEGAGNLTQKSINLIAGGIQGPFSGRAIELPKTIEAEDFDYGGAGISFMDNTPGNNGNNGGADYRAEDVDITKSNIDGKHRVAKLTAGEWMEYTVDVAQSGDYLAEFWVSSNNSTGKWHLENNGTDLTGILTVSSRGDWDNWAQIKKVISLNAGEQVLRLFIDKGGFAIDKIVIKTIAGVSLSKNSLDFGDLIALQGNESQVITIKNTGDATASDLIITLPTAPEGFSINSPSAQNGKITLSPSESAELNIEFEPQIVKTFDSTIKLDIKGAGDLTEKLIDVKGTGLQPKAVAEVTEVGKSGIVSELDFGTVEFGSSDNSTKQLKIENTGAAIAAPINLTIPATLNGFAFNPNGELSIAGQESETITITFSPTVPTDANQKQNVYTDVLLNLGDLAGEIKLNGTGIRAAAVAKTTESANSNITSSEVTSLDFGTVETGTNSANLPQKVIKIWNEAPASAALLNVNVPANLDGFTLSPNGDLNIAGGESEIITITFSPNEISNANVNEQLYEDVVLNVTGNADDNILLSGKVIRPLAKAKVTEGVNSVSSSNSITTLDFGAAEFGNSTPPQKVLKIWNTGSANATALNVSIPEVPAGFVISSSGDLNIAGGESATITISFVPVVPTSANENTTIYENVALNFGNSVGTIELNGTGVRPAAEFAIFEGNSNSPIEGAVSLSFENLAAGKVSAAKQLTIKNRASSEAVNLVVTMPALPEGFEILPNTAITIPAGESKSIIVSFVPTIAKVYDTTIEFGIQGADNLTTQPITLNGTSVREPFSSLIEIPRIIEAENFDYGGEGYSYHNEGTRINSSTANQHRKDGIDITPATSGGGYYCEVAANEWIEYTVNVAQAGDYVVEFSVASNSNSGKLHLEKSGQNLTGEVIVNSTGGTENWVQVSESISLSTGEQIIRLVIDEGDFNIDKIEFIEAIPATAKITKFDVDATQYQAAVAETKLGFGTVVAGETITKNLKVWNTTSSGASILGLNIAPTLPEGFTATLGKNLIGSGEYATLAITFKPMAAKSYNNSLLNLNLLLSSSGTPQSSPITLNGKGKASPPKALLTESNVNNVAAAKKKDKKIIAFGVVKRKNSKTLNYKIWNPSVDGNLKVKLPSNIPEGYKVTMSNNKKNVVIKPGESVTLKVVFRPLKIQAKYYDKKMKLSLTKDGKTVSNNIELRGKGRK